MQRGRLVLKHRFLLQATVDLKESWKGVLNATHYGPTCPQRVFRRGPFLNQQFQNEDCLYLNVYAPMKVRSLLLVTLVNTKKIKITLLNVRPPWKAITFRVALAEIWKTACFSWAHATTVAWCKNSFRFVSASLLMKPFVYNFRLFRMSKDE